MSRAAYFKQRYDDKKAAGLCTKSGCSTPTIATLCDKHARQNRWIQERRRMSQRERLPDDRDGTTMHFTIIERVNEQPDGSAETREIKGYLTANTYPDGRLGEIFVRLGKAGSTEAWVDIWCIACSMLLQRGASVDEVFSKFVGQQLPPAGSVKWVPGITKCKSVVDLVSRHLINRFGTPQ